ncbi:UDP-glucose 4-epimerase [Orobanche gracilis]
MCCEVYILGTRQGASVLKMFAAFEKASEKQLKFLRKYLDDDLVIVRLFMHNSQSRTRLEVEWAKYGIDEMCRDQWNWASKHPYGYELPKCNGGPERK